MIVNAHASVDKPDFLHKLKGLPSVEAAEQGLRLAGTETGQKNGCGQVAWFRTFDPVDIHGLVHRGGQFTRFQRVFRSADRVDVAILARLAALPESENFFE